eukprot:3864513-Rhodomonas_salina.2
MSHGVAGARAACAYNRPLFHGTAAVSRGCCHTHPNSKLRRSLSTCDNNNNTAVPQPARTLAAATTTRADP